MTKDNNLIVRHGTDLVIALPSKSTVISRMASDVLKSQSQVKLARHIIGNYKFNEPDYQQILHWASIP